MAEQTSISWADSTFNPWIGCTKVGPGCDHCYAEVQDSRKRWGGATHWGAGVPRYRTSASYWKQPLAWNKKAAASGKLWRVFCASLADVFDNEAPQEWRDDLWRLIEATPHLSWLLVTKRIGNVEKMVPSLDWLRFHDNVRILITVCNQEEADRDIPKLLALPVRNGISYEPALGPVTFGMYLSRTNMPGLRLMPGFRDPLSGIEWIIVGGESAQGGAKARPFNVEWARSTISQCKAAGIPVFTKQIGSTTVGWCLGNNQTGDPDEIIADCQSWESGEGGNCPDGFCACRLDRAGADPAEWPMDLRVREFP